MALANLNLAGVALTFKLQLPVVLMEIPVASSGVHALVQAAGSCMLEIVAFQFAIVVYDRCQVWVLRAVHVT